MDIDWDEMDEQIKEKAMTSYVDLSIQAAMFDMNVDWETMSLMPKRTSSQPAWLTAHIERNADKQMDHEIMNRDGGQ